MTLPDLHLGWILFGPLVLALLATDLILFHRDPRPVDLRRSLQATAGWVALALAFAGLVAFTLGITPAMEFLTGYVVELSLSVDNVFVFAVLLRYFAVPEKSQFPALFWGIIGALFLRALFIFTGIALINRFHWLIYIFGALLVYTGIKLLKGGEAKVEKESVYSCPLVSPVVLSACSLFSTKFVTNFPWQIISRRNLFDPTTTNTTESAKQIQ